MADGRHIGKYEKAVKDHPDRYRVTEITTGSKFKAAEAGTVDFIFGRRTTFLHQILT